MPTSFVRTFVAAAGLAIGLGSVPAMADLKVAATIKPGDHGTTFGGGPLVAAVADHVVSRTVRDSAAATIRHVPRRAPLLRVVSGAWSAAHCGAPPFSWLKVRRKETISSRPMTDF